MPAILHPSQTRGHGDHGWLQARHSFSFAEYHDPARMRFGLLRVLNDDIVAPGMGFDTHPHRNMEIITIPLSGMLAHKDSMGHERTLSPGEVQVMSAGSGLTHSEYNGSDSMPVNLLQIWIFPKVKDIEPAYDQRLFPAEARQNQWQLLVSPDGEGDSLTLNQDAWLSRVDLSAGQSITASKHDASHGLYLFVIDGQVTAGDERLHTRDAIGLEAVTDVSIHAMEDARVLSIEVPMR
jgi:redox-sensitive bicupin YhaK (pirin superfamily)